MRPFARVSLAVRAICAVCFLLGASTLGALGLSGCSEEGLPGTQDASADALPTDLGSDTNAATDLGAPDAAGADAPPDPGPGDGTIADGSDADGSDSVDGGPDAADVSPLDVLQPDVGGGVGLAIDYSTTDPGATPRWDPQGATWTKVGWPSDYYRDAATGSVDLSNLPNPEDSDLLSAYLVHGMEVLDGFGLNGAVYFQLDSPLDQATLPAPEATTEPGAHLQLVNVTVGSGRHGERLPLRTRFHGEGGDIYYESNTLALLPVYGFPLAEGETYCAVVTRAVKDAEGRYLQPSEAFAEALRTEASLAPLLSWLQSDAMIRPEDIAVATCFTTQRATAELRAVVALLDTSEAPTIEAFWEPGIHGEFHGLYTAPNFQAGDKPYADEGGGLELDDSGVPIVQAQEQLRYLLLVPTAREMPADGWPVVIYAHGTGGDYESCRGTAGTLVPLGIAVLCVDQPLHGTRSGETDELNETQLVLYSFNFFNPPAGRTAFRQAAIDTLVLNRMIAAGSFDLAAAQTTSGLEVRLDAGHIGFFGHSHGGLSGALVLGVDPLVEIAVLSGAAGVLVETILRRTDPANLAVLVGAALGIHPDDLDPFHPMMTVVQMLVETTDPINYAPYWLNPAAGGTAKHVFVTEGTADHASPSVGTDAMGAAAGLPLLGPLAKVSAGHALAQLPLQDLPVQGNTPAGTTAGLKQWEGGSHFVALSNAEARAIWTTFFATWLEGTTPVLGADDNAIGQRPALSAGDTCDTAGVIASTDLPAVMRADTSLAADDYSSGACGGGADDGVTRRDVVYAFVPDADGFYRFELSLPAAIDDKTPRRGPNLLYVTTDCAAVGSGCLGRTGSSLDLELSAGTTVYAIVDGLGVEDKGAFSLVVQQLCVHAECGDRECGVAGCYSCGSCSNGEVCSPDGQCVTGGEGDTCAEPFLIEALPFSGVGTTDDFAGDYAYGSGQCPGMSSGYGATSADVVYAFTAAETARHRFTLDATFDGNLYVVEDCEDVAGTCLAAHRRSSGAENILVDLTMGQQVFVVVDGASNSGNSRGSYALRADICAPDCDGKQCGDDGCGGTCGACGGGLRCVDEPTCHPIPYVCVGHAECEVIPVGERCELPFEVDGEVDGEVDFLPFSASGTTKSFHDEYAFGSGQCPGESSGYGGSAADVVYAFTAPGDAIYTIALDPNHDSSLYVVSDCADIAGSCLGADEVKGDGKNERLDLTLTGGERVFIVVDGRSSSAHQGGYDLSISECTPSCDGSVCGGDGCGGSCGSCGAVEVCSGGSCKPAPGDTCDIPLNVNSIPYKHDSNSGSFNNSYLSSCGDDDLGGASGDVAYRFVAKADVSYTVRLDASFDATFSVVEDCSDTSVCLASGQGTGVAGAADVVLANGQEVYILIDGDAADPAVAQGSFTLRVSETCFPSCDGRNCGSNGCGGSCGACVAPADICSDEGLCTDPTSLLGNTCALPHVVGQLPFAATGDSSLQHNHYQFNHGHCGDFVGKGRTSSDEVWQLTAGEPGTYWVAVVPDGFDAVLYAASDCGAIPDTCLGADDGQLVEVLALELAAGQVVNLIVDGVDTVLDKSGVYTIEVRGP